jgi:hypothetical protein
MSAMLALVMGLVGKIGSASNGAVLPSFSGGMPFMLHSEEWVLPKDKATGLDRLIASGGGTTVNISTMDARGVYEHVLAQRRAYGDAFTEIARRG